MDGDLAGQHPLSDRLRLLEGHVEDVLDLLALLERRNAKHELEIEALTGQMCEITGGIRDMLKARLQRDNERDEDRAILRRLVLSAIGLALATVLAHAAVAWLGATGAVHGFDFRGFFPPPHSSELPREAGGKAP